MTPKIVSGTLAIIPARGGSKGLPRKNVRLLGELPLIAHTIRAAIRSGIERVLVSTDDDEIAGIAREHGAEVPFMRPPELATDQASSLSVLLHAMEWVEQDSGSRLDHVIFLQPTSPFRNSTHIHEALQLHCSSDRTSLVSVTEVQEFHPYFMFSLEEKGIMNPLFQMEERPLRRQDLPPYYRLNGAIYISRRSYYDDLPPTAAIFDWDSLCGYSMDAPSSVDINDYLDFQRAEWLLREEQETS